MKIVDKINEYLDENAKEESDEIKKLIDGFYLKHKGNSKKVRQSILDNIVNTKYGRKSNQYVDKV